MLCPQCKAVCTPDDNYCHRCGQYLRLYRLPVEPPRRAIEPAVRMAPTLVRGGMYLVLMALGQWALRQGLRALLSRALTPRPRRPLPSPRQGELPSPRRQTDEGQVTYFYSETLVVRRILRRR